MAHLRTFPHFNSVRQDPRFNELLERMNLPGL